MPELPFPPTGEQLLQPSPELLYLSRITYLLICFTQLRGGRGSPPLAERQSCRSGPWAQILHCQFCNQGRYIAPLSLSCCLCMVGVTTELASSGPGGS